MTVLKAFIVITFVVLVGCAKTPTVPPPQYNDSRVYDSTYNEVWVDLMDFFANNEIPLENTDKESGYVRTEKMKLKSDNVGIYAWSGYELPSKRVNSGLIRATVFVKELPNNKASVKVNTLVKLYQDYCCTLSPGGWFDGRSSGEFEQSLLYSINTENPQQIDLKETIDLDVRGN